MIIITYWIYRKGLQKQDYIETETNLTNATVTEATYDLFMNMFTIHWLTDMIGNYN